MLLNCLARLLTLEKLYRLYGYLPVPTYAMELPVRNSNSELHVPPPTTETFSTPRERVSLMELKYSGPV